MESLEVRARTVEEATQRALRQLGLSRDQVAVVVVREGRGGILGLGAEDAIVRVTPIAVEPPAPAGGDVVEAARRVLEQLLRLLGISATVEVDVQPAAVGREEGTPSQVSLNIRGEDLGILIGRRGQTLMALQYIVRLLVSRQVETRVPIAVDVEGYKQRRRQSLQMFAREMADRVRVRGVPFPLEPMPADERRIVHLALADYQGVTTESIGQGDERKVVILPKKK